MVIVYAGGNGHPQELLLGEAKTPEKAIELVKSDPSYPRGVYRFQVGDAAVIGWGTEKHIIEAVRQAWELTGSSGAISSSIS